MSKFKILSIIHKTVIMRVPTYLNKLLNEKLNNEEHSSEMF